MWDVLGTPHLTALHPPCVPTGISSRARVSSPMPTSTSTPRATARHARGGVAKLVADASALSTPHALLPYLQAAAATKAQPKARRCCKPASSTRRRQQQRARSPTARRPVIKARR